MKKWLKEVYGMYSNNHTGLYSHFSHLEQDTCSLKILIFVYEKGKKPIRFTSQVLINENIL